MESVASLRSIHEMRLEEAQKFHVWHEVAPGKGDSKTGGAAEDGVEW